MSVTSRTAHSRAGPTSAKAEYLEWATSVVKGCCGINDALDRAYTEAVTLAREKLGIDP